MTGENKSALLLGLIFIFLVYPKGGSDNSTLHILLQTMGPENGKNGKKFCLQIDIRGYRKILKKLQIVEWFDNVVSTCLMIRN